MTDERIIAYLLGELPEEESERFEDECFALEDWPGQLDAVEEDLIEDYLRGGLAPERRLGFERHYLTTAARLERVRVAAALLRHVDEIGGEEETAEEGEGDAAPSPPDGKKPGGWFSAFWGTGAWAPRAAWALLAVAFIAGAWWLYRAEPGRAVATLTLTASSGDRAEGARPGRASLAPETGLLRLSLILPEGQPPASRYRAELEDESGDKKAFEVKEQDARSVTVEVPASQLSRRLYSLRLFAVQDDGAERRVRGSYLFMVE